MAYDVADMAFLICRECHFILEEFVQMGGRLADATLQGGRKAAIVDHRQMTDVPTLAEQWREQ